ncbi:MAG: GTPase HflX [Gammaproteobacteria bacterium]|nr:GTPase HflX [Gammaproteobacteria bacterium]
MFERPDSGGRAILVNAGIRTRPQQRELQEFAELAAAAGAECVASIVAVRDTPDPRFFVGRGKVDEIIDQMREQNADLVIFSQGLSPAQERNLERRLQCRVLDRSGLILDIFAQRARSHEGKLQVELAQLRHLSTRLIRGWTHLERQKGGIGLRGPGETQLETDRRLINVRIKSLNEQLGKVRARRRQNRRNRQRTGVAVVSLVGYTNAGKSTLFNRLASADAFVADQLFATLDPTLRRIEPENGAPFVLADTVGFVENLPHELVAAFRSTLEETLAADLLVHVVDASDPDRRERIAQVNRVIEEIGAQEIPQILVFNKIDLVAADEVPNSSVGTDSRPAAWVSARNGDGIADMLRIIDTQLRGTRRRGWLRIHGSDGRLRALLYEMKAVLDERVLENGELTLNLDLDETTIDRILREQAVRLPVELGASSEDAIELITTRH